MIYEGPGWRITTNDFDPVVGLLAPYRANDPPHNLPFFAVVEVAGVPSFVAGEFLIVTPTCGARHIVVETPEIAVCLPSPRRVPDVG